MGSQEHGADAADKAVTHVAVKPFSVGQKRPRTGRQLTSSTSHGQTAEHCLWILLGGFVSPRWLVHAP